MTGPLLLFTCWALLRLTVATDLVLVTRAGEPSELFRKALSLMEDRDGEAGQVASKEKILAEGIKRRAMLAVSRRIKRKPSPVRTVSSESLYNQPAAPPRQRIKFSQRRVFSSGSGSGLHRERLRSTTSPRPFSLLRNMQIKRRRRKFQPKPPTEAPFVERKVSKPCEEEMRPSEDIADNEVQVGGKVRLAPTHEAENMTAAEVEASPKRFVELQSATAASSSERGKEAEGRPLEIFEEHEVKHQIQDKISLMVADETVNGIKGEYDDKTLESIINNSKDDENLIIEGEDSKVEIDNNTKNAESPAASDFFPEEVTTLEPFVTPQLLTEQKISPINEEILDA